MKPVKTILSSLPDNATDFVVSCSVSALSETLSADLDKALEYGRELQEGIEIVMEQLRDVKIQMETE